MNTDLTRKLITDYRVVLADAEALVKAVASQSADKIADARAQMQQALVELKPRLTNAEAKLKEKTQLAANAADEYVHHNPWLAMGAVASLGIVVGLLIGRR